MKRLLVFAPHPDDEILGCGGTIIKNIQQGNEVYVCVVTRGYPPYFDIERINKNVEDAVACHQFIGIKKTFFLDFPAVQLESVNRFDLNGKVLDVVKEVMPDEVYIPHYGDMQKDHQMISEATMVVVRPKSGHRVKKVFAYETLSETEWNIPHCSNTFIPNVYHDISDYLDKKIEAMRMYRSQLSDFPNPRSLDAITSLAKYRGSTVLAEAAEAFMLIREIR